MLEALFGNESIERVLFYLLRNKTCYALQLKNQFQSPLSPMQQALLRLEKGGILVSTLVGKTRLFQFNPRYLFLDELLSFLQRVYETLPEEIKNKYYEIPIRKRPRRTGKPLP
ncbi:MAG TPA: hypothetical protein VIJ14_07485 [Rhabdochlamydiaceae bacterium]